MTINVHTYYRNRLALEEAVERARVRQEMNERYATPVKPAAAPRKPIAIPVMVVYGLLVGLAYAAWVALCLGGGQGVGLLAGLGAMWGLIWGLFFHLNRNRIADFLQALMAEPVPAAALMTEEMEEPLDLSWMNKPAADGWSPAPSTSLLAPGPKPLLATTPEPLSTFPKPKKTVPNTQIETPTKSTPMGSMLNQLTESLGETAEPKAPPKAKVWGTPVEMARRAG